MLRKKIVYSKKIYTNFPYKPSFDRARGFCFNIVKNVIKNKKFHFAPNSCGIRKKC